jgi:SecD/SecF fusion protein
MQNKGAIRLFAIIFALVCIYQLSFTYVTNSVESDAQENSNGDPAAYQAYLDSISGEVVYDIFIDQYTYSETKSREINLGLDLKGGMNVILEVSVRDILKALSQNSKNPVFNQALTRASERQTNSQENYITLFYEEFQKANTEQGTNYKLSDPAIFGNRELSERINFNTTDQEVVAILREEADGAIDRAFTVLRARIDKFGVAQPNIQRLEGTGRILVELPGVKEPDRVKRLLQSTANLEFWETYENGDAVFSFFNTANERLKTIIERPAEFELEDGDSTSTEASDMDFEEMGVADTDSASNEDALAANDSVSALDTANTQTDQWNPFFAVLQPNVDFQAGQYIPGPVVGYAALQDTGKVMEYLRMRQIQELIPAELRYVKFLWAAPNATQGENFLALLAIKGNRSNEAPLQGDNVVDASQDFDQLGQPSITMRMSSQGARIWADLTEANVDRSIAVVLDNIVYSYPNVNEPITGGVSNITGSFSVKEAKDLANILKAGKLPAPAKIIQADVVGPSLGQEAITSGLYSFLIALGVVLIYMIFYYSSAGLVSNVALLVNIFFIFGVLASVQAVLTLPGIAGIVLTIGMAVDANVLIYERIREELRAGKGLRAAVKDGYMNAYSSILDANITTLLTGIILFVFGTGPIRGFAITLIIGILTSLFSAILITRLVFENMLSRKKDFKFGISSTINAFSKVNIDWLGKRKIGYIISGIIIAAGIASLSTRGLNQGVDFSGGRSYQVRFDQEVNTQEITDALSAVFVDESGVEYRPEVKTFGGNSQVKITTKFRIDEKGADVDEAIQGLLYEGVKGFFVEAPTEDHFFNDSEGKSIGLMSATQVGPTIADDIRQSAVLAIIFSLVIIFVYILVRFRKWQFSLGAVAAVFHDSLIVISLFSLLYGILPFSLEIDQAFIAAILTVIGYSLNDTVVVFDRIREYMREHRKMDFTPMVNTALNSTLSRTINTSLTTLFVLLIIFFFGGETIRGFMFALVVGIIVGTYSSLFIASPIMHDTLKKTMDKKRA